MLRRCIQKPNIHVFSREFFARAAYCVLQRQFIKTKCIFYIAHSIPFLRNVATSPHDDHCALASSVVSAASTFPLLRFDFDVTSGVQQTVQESVRGTGTVGFLLSFYTLQKTPWDPVCTPSLLSKGRAPLQLYELL